MSQKISVLIPRSNNSMMTCCCCTISAQLKYCRCQLFKNLIFTRFTLTHVCVLDYEPNCTMTVLHIMNNRTEAWRLFSATAELLLCRRQSTMSTKALSPVHTSNNVEATVSNATSWTILSTMSNVASTLLPFLATMLPVSTTMSNEISSFQQSRNKLNMFNSFRLCRNRKDEISFDIVAVCGNKVECCFDKVERCFDIVSGVDGALGFLSVRPPRFSVRSSRQISRYGTIRYGRLTCAQKLTRWPA